MDLATIQIKVDTRDVKAANDDIANLGKTGKQVGKDVSAANDNMAQSAKSTTSAFKLLGGAIAALGVGALVSNFTKTVTESERLKGSLTTMTGSVENAGFAFAELERFASQTPFTLDQSVEGFIKLKALGLDPSERALRSYGNTSAAMGKDMMQMIEAVADASTGEFERLKEFGIKASSEGDKVSLTFQGVTTTIGKNSQEIQEYLLGIGETKFGSAMEDQMQRLPGLLSNLQDNIDGLFRKIGDTGGITLFGTAISAASALIVGITNNLDILGTGLAAATAGFIAFTVGSNLSAILGGFTAMKAAVIALNTAIRANPIGFIASAIAVAATAIIMNWDKIRVAAEKSAINIQIAWNKLKLFLMQAFAPALTAISDMFTDVQDNAVATWSAVAAAAKSPLNAISVFNDTFDSTLQALRSGREDSGVFKDAISATETQIIALENELEALNTELVTSEDTLGETTMSLSDFATEIDNVAQETENLRTKTDELLAEIKDEKEALGLSSLELEIRNNLQKAGVDATSEFGQEIIAATTELHNEKEALKAADEQTKALQKATEEATKEMAERYKAMKDSISGFFVDLFENGKSAFSNLAETFKQMLLKMVADILATKVLDYIAKIVGFTGSSTLSGAVSAVTSSIASSVVSSAGSAAAGSAAGTAAGAAGAAAAGAGAAGAAAAGTGAGAATTGGTGILASIGGGVKAAGAAISNAISAIPGWGWALGGVALAAKLLDKSGTMSSNAGMLLHDVPGAKADQKFTVAPFDSGFAPVGFARRDSQDNATAIIDMFRGYDTALTQIAKSVGMNVDFNYGVFNNLGTSETGQGTGVFVGIGAEDGKVKSQSLQDQADQYVRLFVEGLSGQLHPDAKAQILSAGNADAMVQKALELAGGVDGSHRDGLDMVPYDGYVAELHAGERVQTAEQARASDNVADEMSGLRQSIEDVMIAVARNTSKLYRLNDRWDKNGLPPVRT